MGIYDNFIIPSSGEYISTYAGQPLAETAQLGETLNKAYNEGMGGVSAYQVIRDNASVLSADEDYKEKTFDDSYKVLE
jgi:hypothetical protein